MAGKRFRIVDQGGHNTIPTVRFQTEANVAVGAIDPGMLLKWKANGSPYVVPLVDGDHTIGTDTAIIGLAASTGTQTAAADGTIDVYMPLPGIIYRGYATTGSNVAATLVGDRVGIDVSATTAAGDWTVDENEGETQALAFCIVGVDTVEDTVDFIIRQGATYLGDQDLS